MKKIGILILMTIPFILAGCGGGSSGSGPNPPPPSGTGGSITIHNIGVQKAAKSH